MTRLDRRRFLAAAGAVAAATAGCQAPSDGTPTPGGYADRARAFLGELAAGEYEQAHERFTEDTADALPVSRLRAAWERQETQYGDYREIAALNETDREGAPAVEATLSYESGSLRAITTFEDGGITGFLLRPPEWTPPGYADSAAFEERTLSLAATEDCSLGATLSVPDDAAAGETPGVVIVHGSGPSDRDGTFGPNRVYKDLAWGLASRGVAVLRYAKRNFACDVDMADATVHDVVTEDALTAVSRLRETDALAADDVVVAGHSLGGTLTPEIARRDGDLAGVAMLAALHRPANKAIVDQTRYIAERDGTVTDEEQAAIDRVESMAEQIETLDIGDDETVHLGGEQYWRTLQEYDHDAVAADLEIPQLYCNGGRDWQVTLEDDLAAWRNALEGMESVTFETYDDCNHLFMPGEGTPGRQEYFQENHVAETVIADLAAFADRVTT